MAENSQLSGNMKNSSTGTSSTDTPSEAIGKHENEIVPHKISNHDKLVQTMVMVDGEWINVNDTNDQANMKDDMNKVNKKVVEAQKGIVEAKSAADSAAKAADSAVSASVVNSDAITAQSAAISEAKSAISSANAAIQQTAATAASDAAKIRVDVAQVQSEIDANKAANSASVKALKSDISAAKQDLADVHDSLTKAQSAIEQNQKLINDNVAKITSDVSATKQELATVHDSLTKAQAAAEQNQKAIDKSIAQINDSVDATNQDLAGVRKDLTKAQSDITANQKSINDNVAKINADITQDRKDIASAQQANADTAKQLDTYSKQATEQSKTIKTIQDKQDGFTATLADVQGNVSQVSDKVDGLSASLKDAQGNVASVKAQADQLSATLTDHAKSIATLTASAKELSSTLEDADGRLSKVEQTAQTNSSTLSDVQGNLSQVKQQADGLVSTLKDAQGNISTLQQKADSVSAQLASAQGDIATLQTGVAGVKATLASHDKTIHTLKLDSKSLKDSMADAQGDISALSKTATSLDSEMKDHAGRLSKVEQNAATQATTLSDLQGNLTQVKQQADGLVTTLKDAQGSITQIQQKADGMLEQLKSAQGDIATLQTGIDGVKAILTSHDKSIHTLQADSKSLKDSMVNAQGDISTLRKTATDVTSELEDHTGRLSKVEQSAAKQATKLSDLQGNLSQVEQKADSNTATISSINKNAMQDRGVITDTKTSFDSLTQLGTYSIKATGLPKMPEQHYGTLVVSGSAGSGWLSQQFVADTTGNVYTRIFSNNAWSAWKQGGSQDAINQVKQTADSNSATIRNVQGDVSTLKQTATGIKSTLASHEGDIHTLQADSKSLKDSMTNAQGDISTLKKTSTDVVSELKNHAGRISKTEQTASTLVNELADQQGHLNRVEQKATGTEQTVANQQGQINDIKTDVSGVHETITGQGKQIANINVTLSGLNTKYEGVSGDLNNLKSQAQWATVTSAVDLNNVKTPCHEFLKGTVTNAPNEVAWWYLTVEGSESGRITQTVIADQSNNRYTRRWADGWSAWVKDATQTDVTALSNRITTNSTQITQNKQAIALKADQSTVNNLSGEVSQNKAQLQIQAGQISSKVSSTDFKTLNDKVNGLQIGGRNLLLGTSTTEKSGKSYYFAQYSIAGGLQPGTTYTLSGWARVDQKAMDNKQNVFVCAYTSDWSWSSWLNIAGSLTAKYNKITFTTPTGKSFSPVVTIYLSHPNNDSSKDSISGQGFISKLKLEKGNVATDWTPAPEDLTTAIQNNSTAIDQTNKQISLKADQTEVDQVKQTASQNSSRLDVMAGQISSRVTSTDVNNIVDSKGYATTSTVQSLITQKAGTINESITNLTSEMNTRNGVNLLKGTKDFSGSWRTWDDGNHWHTENWLDLNGNPSLKSDTMEWAGYYQPIWLEKGEYTFSCYYNPGNGADLKVYIIPNGGENLVQATGNGTKLDSTPNQWHLCVLHFKVTKAGNAAVRIESSKNAVFHIASYKLEKGTVTKPVWTPAPSDNATVTQVQQITASIDGLQSTVANKADKSQITQLSNVIQSKVSTDDFNNLRKAVDLQTLDSADINNMKTNGHYFVHNLTNNPVGGWAYVDVTGNGADRIRQDVYQDNGNQHKYRRWFGNSWTDWSQGATESEITQLRDDINLRVKSGDLLSQINIQAGRTLIQSNKIYFDADSFVMSPNSKAFIPSAFITDLSADKITTGTLDASKLHVKNFSADNISGGTLSGITVKTGDKNRYFQTSKDSIYWVRDNKTSLIGTDQYINPSDGLVIADTHSVTLTTWYGATVKDDGTITNGSGNIGYPKLILDSDGKWEPDASGGSRWEGNTGKAQIGQWIADKEYTNLVQGKGFVVHLDDQNKDSIFAIQKDNCVGAYFGRGEHGNHIDFVTVGDDQAVNITGNFHVTGSKNSIVETKQGYLAINAYETAEYYFGDIGESNTGASGKVIVGIDKIFNETVNTDIQYQVFLTSYGNARLWVSKRYNNRFVVESDTPNAEFGWELKAKRKGYEGNRLRVVHGDFDNPTLLKGSTK